MKVLRCLLLFGIFTGAALFPVLTSAQLWSGVLESTHGTDWSRAGATGAPGHSSSWSQCGSTIAAYSGAATTINSALSSCGANQYVLLGPGTFNLSSGITISKSNVALRGSGADQTFLVFGSGASTGCNGLGALVCIQGPNVSASSNPAGTSWTAGYAQGSNQITLASTSGITANTTMIVLDQCDDGTSGASCSGTETDNGNFYVCSQPYSGGGGCAGEAASNAYRSLRSQIQITYATNVSGSVVTIADPVVAPNWRSSQSPQAWLYSPVTNAGLEDVTVDSTAANNDAIKLYGCMNCWVTGNRVVNPNKRAITLFESAHVDVQNNYSYGAQNSDPYCISPDYTSFLRIENNIIQRCRSTIVYEGPDTGTVVAYNLSIGDWDGGTSYMWFSLWTHSSASMYNLYEGNIGNGLVFDNIHGSHQMNTLFRDYYSGWEPGKSGQTNAFYSAAYARYSHVIGSVLGTPGYHKSYQSQTATSSAIFVLGAGGDSNGVPTDARVLSTSMRWGNYDTVNGSVQWNASEVPSGDSAYPNPVPASHSLPASFYLTSKPKFWGSEPWPAIGPDVSGGVILGTSGTTSWATLSLSGYANATPALDCYKNVMGGPADGSGSALKFNADVCYNGGTSTSNPPPAAPTGLSATVN